MVKGVVLVVPYGDLTLGLNPAMLRWCSEWPVKPISVNLFGLEPIDQRLFTIDEV
jgi:hypothetical protein